MNRLKLFVENFLVYGLGGMISKLIPLVMLPIITRLMPDTIYFGLNDLSNMVVSFGSAIAVMGMYDAMFRLYFDRQSEEWKKEICSTTLAFTLCTSLSLFFVLVIFRGYFAKLFFSDEQLGVLLCLSAISILIGATNSIVSAPTRMQNKRKVYLLTNTLTSLLSYAVAVPLLLRGHFIIAMPLSCALSAGIIEIIFVCLNRNWFSIRKVRRGHLTALLKIALPLMPNFIVYWVFNSCDRLMISKLIGTEYTGIYAVGAKLGQLSQLVYTAFAGGWQYFAFATMDDKDQVGLTSKIFEYLGVISFILTMVVATFSQLIFNILFTGDYLGGYIVAPYLFLAPLLQMLFQVVCNQFLVIKKTWPNIIILGIGAVVNVLFNLFAIPHMGIEGAALATLLGYTVSVVLAVVVLTRMNLIRLSARCGVSCLNMLLFLLVWRVVFHRDIRFTIFLLAFEFVLYFILYRKETSMIILKLKKSMFGEKNEKE